MTSNEGRVMMFRRDAQVLRTLLPLCGLLLAAQLLLACSDGGSRAPRAEVSTGEAYSLLQSEAPPIFLDVRSQTEYDGGHIEGAVHIPHTEVAARLDELRELDSSEIIIFCERGGRSRIAEEALEQAGEFEVKHLQGDMRGWRRMQLPTVPTSR